MVYLAELLVVMTDGLKIVKICARNVPRTRTQAHIDDDAFLTPLVSRARCAVLLKHKETVSRQLAWQWLLSKEDAATVCPFTLTPNLSNLIVINPVLGKNLEHPHLTR